MSLSSPWQVTGCAAIQELLSNLWNPKIHYYVNKSLPLVSVLSQINPVHTTPSYLRSIITLSTHLHLGLPSSLFLYRFPANILHAFLFALFMLHALPISAYSAIIHNTITRSFLLLLRDDHNCHFHFCSYQIRSSLACKLISCNNDMAQNYFILHYSNFI
jgi:hypothetical protein